MLKLEKLKVSENFTFNLARLFCSESLVAMDTSIFNSILVKFEMLRMKFY